MTTAITVKKAKVASITERYHAGEYRSVTQPDEYPRVAVCGLDNSHNRDYKVTYASDPLLVVTAGDESLSHGDLRSTLERHDVWLQGFNPIEVPYTTRDGEAAWRVGYKSLPRSSNRLDRVAQVLRKRVERDTDILEGENTVTAYLPTG